MQEKLIRPSKILLSSTSSVTRFGEISPICPFLGGSVSILQNLEPTSAIFYISG